MILLQVKETARDVRFLHNEMFFAAAQRKYVYIYDKRGIEVHCLKVSTTLLLHSQQQYIQVFLPQVAIKLQVACRNT